VTIWEDKAQARLDKVAQLRAELQNSRDEYALLLVQALDYYGANQHDLPHKDWVKIRKELIVKAENYLSTKGQNK
jgi:hypothetical protein